MAKLTERGQALAKRLISENAQGSTVYVQPGDTTGPAFDPTVGPPTRHNVSAVQINGGIRDSYVSGGSILESDILLNVAPFETNPKLEGIMEINGKDYEIVHVSPSTVDPDTPIVWRVGCRA